MDNGAIGGTVVDSAPDESLRHDLAAAFRWAARLDLHEGVANHFSVAISDDGGQFLLNPRGRHFSRVRASELLLLDAADVDADGVDGVDADPTAWYLHSHLHRHVPNARCVLHTHMPHATALACLREFEFLMLDQTACRFHGRIAYDRHYGGMALDDAEGERVAKLLGTDHSVLFLGNHGVIVVGPTIADAFDELYHLERAARLQVLALSTGRPLDLIPDEIAAITCRQWLEYPEAASLHFAALKEILDDESPDYRD